MNNIPLSGKSLSSRYAVVAGFILLAWLISLTAAVCLEHQASSDFATRNQLETTMHRLNRTEGKVEQLVHDSRVAKSQPRPASQADLQATQEAFEARMKQLEQTVLHLPSMDDLDGMRKGLEQLTSRQEASQGNTATSPRRVPIAVSHKTAPLPFRVVAAELRAGQPALLIAPTSGPTSVDALQALLPGESINNWLLVSIDGKTAFFRSGAHTRRLVIP